MRKDRQRLENTLPRPSHWGTWAEMDRTDPPETDWRREAESEFFGLDRKRPDFQKRKDLYELYTGRRWEQ